MASSCRIDFTGEAGRICRTQPPTTTGHMTAPEWISFCDGVDAELEPLESARTMAAIGLFVSLWALVSSLVAICDRSDGPSESSVFFGPVCMWLCVLAASSVANARTAGVMRRVDAVCEEASGRHPPLSFRLRYEYRARGERRQRRTEAPEATHRIDAESRRIEVSVAASALPATAAPCCGKVYSAAPVVDAPTKPMDVAVEAVAAGGRGAAERLAELEEIRPMLGEGEYARKRRDIIDSV